MAVDVPLIYSPRCQPIKLPLAGRAVAFAISLACLAVFITANRLTPDPSGMGTHTQLNLPECNFYRTTGLPCPSCGMTTSFTWFFHGNFLASFYVQPMGALLAILAAIAFWTGLYIAVTGQPVYRLARFVPLRYGVIALIAFGIVAWAWKIFIHVHGIDGWTAS
jgi:Protein of unknown function (DUF2752)